jgi:dTDP-4-amino-4,6-dideoxygalactose transaminase
MSTPINVPLLDLKAQYAPMKNEIMEAIERVVESQYFIMGPDVAELEAGVAKYVGSKFAIGCASGSDAIMLALMALGASVSLFARGSPSWLAQVKPKTLATVL